MMETTVRRPAWRRATAACCGLGLAALVGACAAHDTPLGNPGVKMTAADMQLLLVGNTVTGMADNGRPYFAYLFRDGREHFVQDQFRDGGSWQITADDQFCSKLQKTSTNNQKCYTLYRTGPEIAFYEPDGSFGGRFTIQPGIPDAM